MPDGKFIGLTGKTWTLEPENHGYSISNFKQSATSKVFEHQNHRGKTDGRAYYDPWRDYTSSGATTGDLTHGIGDAIVFANAIEGLGGLEAGTIDVTKIDVERTNNGVQTVTYTAKEYCDFAD